MLPHQVRVVEEYDQLMDRLRKLNQYLNSKEGNTLSDEERGAMVGQSVAMSDYSDWLEVRIAMFNLPG